MNRLANETSPYLLQHAENPVDWYPWGEEALERARAEDKPILLSIGYAACHWCHVMERESFEDAETAALMNRHFVSIKVDREERPDLDAIYMDAVQAMTGGGGWPLTAFLTPEGKPFYAGTYYPNEARHGLPAFRTILSAIADVWDNRRPEAEQQSSRITEAIERSTGLGASPQPLTETILVTAFGGLRRAFDPRWGGFGGAPKFPQPMTLEFCLRMHLRGTPDALDVVTITLDKIAGGGMYDQVGGGFHRYSTDERWHVPHFEKMLYDNALLVRLYVHAWQVTGFERYRRVATETCEYLLRELRHARGRSSPPRTRTARASRAGSSSGPGTSSWRSRVGPSRPRSGQRRTATGKARTCCGARCRSRRWPRRWSSIPRSWPASSRRRGPSCSRSARAEPTPLPTTRS